MGDLKDRLTGGISLSNIISIVSLVLIIGMWVGGINRMETELMAWLKDAELEREVNHDKVIVLFRKQRRDINHMNVFLIRKHPNYESISSN